MISDSIANNLIVDEIKKDGYCHPFFAAIKI